MPFPWMVWVFGYPTFPSMQRKVMKSQFHPSNPFRKIETNPMIFVIELEYAARATDWVDVQIGDGCWSLEEKEWLEKNTGGEDFLKEAGLTFFNIIFLLHWVTLQKRRVWLFKENYSVSVGNTFTIGELSIVISRLPQGIEIPIILMNLLLSHVFQECCIGYKRIFFPTCKHLSKTRISCSV